MTDPYPRSATIDAARAALLGDGWRAAVCVNDDGEEAFWLVAPSDGSPAGCACRACAPHEQVDTDRRTPA